MFFQATQTLKYNTLTIPKKHPERFKKRPRCFLKTFGVFFKNHRYVFTYLIVNDLRHIYVLYKNH